MRIKKKIQLTFSGNVANVTFPDSWKSLTQEQLRYVYYALFTFPGVQANTYIFFRLTAMKVVRNITSFVVVDIKRGFFRRSRRAAIPKSQIEWAAGQLNWLHEPNSTPVRLEKIGCLHAIDAQWHGLRFEDYLIVENYYQGFLQTQDLELIRKAARYLYRPRFSFMASRVPAKDYELFAVMHWIASVKTAFAQAFPNFFRRVDTATSGTPDMAHVMNSQIRALTDGDITKEEKVFNMDCWRALTELDAKAKEYAEMKQKYGNK